MNNHNLFYEINSSNIGMKLAGFVSRYVEVGRGRSR